MAKVGHQQMSAYDITICTFGIQFDLVQHRARLVQLHERLHEQLHNFNSQTTSSLPSSLVSFSENSLSQS
jgi:hypothetical protein